MGHDEAFLLAAVGVDDGHGMLGAGPVDAGGRRWFRCCLVQADHGVVLPCCCLSRWAPPTVRDTTAGRSLIGALVALSPVASRRVLGRWASRNSCRTSAGLADVAMTQREPGMHR